MNAMFDRSIRVLQAGFDRDDADGSTSASVTCSLPASVPAKQVDLLVEFIGQAVANVGNSIYSARVHPTIRRKALQPPTRWDPNQTLYVWYAIPGRPLALVEPLILQKNLQFMITGTGPYGLPLDFPCPCDPTPFLAAGDETSTDQAVAHLAQYLPRLHPAQEAR